LIDHDVFYCPDGHFYYAAKSFDILERMDASPAFAAGKMAACISCFRSIVEGNEQSEILRELIGWVKPLDGGEEVVRTIRLWARSSNILI
jgi:hypothetical protein